MVILLELMDQGRLYVQSLLVGCLNPYRWRQITIHRSSRTKMDGMLSDFDFEVAY